MSAQEGKEPPPYRVHTVILTLDRPALHARIDARVERMVAAGLVGEVRGLLERGYSPALPSMSGIGYAEIAAYLRDECTLPAAIERIKFNTHRYVRHQETWFRRNRAATRIEVAHDNWPAHLLDDVGTVLATTHQG
jgi:tRNA dimethylallyltransferase